MRVKYLQESLRLSEIDKFSRTEISEIILMGNIPYENIQPRCGLSILAQNYFFSFLIT